MAKKKHRKKHNFKYTAPSAQTEAAVSAVPTASPAIVAKPSKAQAAAASEDFSYVKRDVTKVGILAAAFTAAQLVLWYLFNHTDLGPRVYQLIKL